MNTMKKRQVGVHVSIAGSLSNAFDRADERGCDCFQIFTKNPRSWKAKPIENAEALTFTRRVEQYRPGTVFAHISYLPNLAGERPGMHEKSVEPFAWNLTGVTCISCPCNSWAMPVTVM